MSEKPDMKEKSLRKTEAFPACGRDMIQEEQTQYNQPLPPQVGQAVYPPCQNMPSKYRIGL